MNKYLKNFFLESKKLSSPKSSIGDPGKATPGFPIETFGNDANERIWLLRRVLVYILFILFIFVGNAQTNAQQTGRGLFVWSLEKEPVLADAKKIDRMLDFAKGQGMDTIFIQVYRSNRSWFSSIVADDELYRRCRKQVGEDPLQQLILKAHAKGIQVHAWMNMLSLGANKDAPLLKKYGPSILTRNQDRKKRLEDYKIDNQFFLEPSDHRVIRSCLKLVEEVLRQYPALDGIQFDYIRYPDVHPFYGYSPDNVARYKRKANKTCVIESDASWKQWKRDQVTNLLKLMVKKANEVNPKVHVSTTGCLSCGRALDEALQDWPSWINSGLVEFVTLMNYPPDTQTYQKNIEGIKAHVPDLRKVNMAVGAYKHLNEPAVFSEHLAACQSAGPRSCVYFHYNNFLENPQLTPSLSKTKGTP